MKDEEIGISPFVLFGRSEKVDPGIHDPKGDPGISPFVLMGRVLVDPPIAEETEETRGTSFGSDSDGEFGFSGLISESTSCEFVPGSSSWDFLPLPPVKRKK